MHPADLVPELDVVLSNARRTVAAAADGRESAGAPVTDMSEDSHNAGHVGDADARQVLTALAYAVEPLAVDDLALVLGWPIERVTAALGHAQRRPALAGPVALRRTQPDTYTVTARLDQLTGAQIRRLGQAQLYRHPLTADQAHMLLAALALNADPERYRRQREAHHDAERDLQRAGLLHTDSGPDRPSIVHDVRYGLRYFNTPDGN
jgi:hypothetical protein